MSRSGFKRFEFFDVDTLSNDVVATLVSEFIPQRVQFGLLMHVHLIAGIHAHMRDSGRWYAVVWRQVWILDHV
jgi:hypothetical protein